MSEREKFLKELKVEIFQRFKLSESSVEKNPLRTYEINMILEQFKKDYAKKDIIEAINTKLKNNKEFKFLSDKIMDKEIRNHFCRTRKLTSKSYTYLASKLDISTRKLEIEFRKLRKENFFTNLGIKEEDFKSARKELRKNKLL